MFRDPRCQATSSCWCSQVSLSQARHCDDDELENTASVDKDVNLVHEGDTVGLLNSNFPLRITLVPYRGLDTMIVLDILVAVVLISNVVHILVKLFRCSIVVGPVVLGSKAESIIVCWDVAFTSRVPDGQLVSIACY